MVNHVPLRLPLWDELPTESLRMKQLLEITNQYVEPIIDDTLTQTMMHNYFKADVLPAPVGKFYEQKDVAGAIVVDLLKNNFSLNEIKYALHWVLREFSPKEGYDNFVNMFNEQAKQEPFSPKSLTSIDLKSATEVTKMQYAGLHSILYWYYSKKMLEEDWEKKQ